VNKGKSRKLRDLEARRKRILRRTHHHDPIVATIAEAALEVIDEKIADCKAREAPPRIAPLREEDVDRFHED